LTPLVLELGGKSANILFEDANLDLACRSSAFGIAMLSGQVCVAPSRLLVHAPIYDAVVERVVNELKVLPIGDPMEPTTVVGPVISENACERILGVIEKARRDGEGDLVSGGGRLARDGFYLEPTVFGNVPNNSSLAQNEVFGPVLSIIRFADEAEAVSIANDSSYGLAAYMYTANLSRAHRIASALDAGVVSINGGSPGAPFMQFGGFKDSGYGKEGGMAGIMEYVRTKQVSIGLG
jgi:aldehyde dehydrogenase (NAD+)